MGHLYGDIHKIDGLKIAKDITGCSDDMGVFPYVIKNLSEYAAQFSDGTEIISEVFSAYHSSVINDFVNEFMKKLK